jgi:simple sugar transport system permease protein
MENVELKQKKSPLVHISKKDNISKRKLVAIKLIAIFLALFVSCIIVGIVYKENPFLFIGSLFEGTFGSMNRLWVFLKDIAILLAIGLALLPAFKMKYWNTGADGQILVAALVAYICIFYMGGKVNDVILAFISLFAAIGAAIIWSVIPAIFKAFWNTNEILFTLMMNYVATQLVSFFISAVAKSGSHVLDTVYYGSLGMIYQYLTPIIIVILLLISVSVYIKHTKHGFELSLVGESVNSARYVGINVKFVIIRTLLVTGIICGLIGFILTNGLNHVVNTNVTGGNGFTAIIVVWMADFNPYFMILSTFMIVFLKTGTNYFLTNAGITDSSIVLIISSIAIFFIIGCTFFSRYKLVFRRNEEGEIDNKFFNFLAKIGTAIENFFTKVSDNIIDLYNKIFRKKTVATNEAIATTDNTEVKQESIEEKDSKNTTEDKEVL